MRLVLAYDVVSDRRRTRFHKRLKEGMIPVQLSVFEGAAGVKEVARAQRLIVEELDLDQDAARIYLLCDACERRMKVFGVAAPLSAEEAAKIF